jgi:hypothetical protein
MRDYEALPTFLTEDEIDGYVHEILDACEAGTMSVKDAALSLQQMAFRQDEHYRDFNPSTAARMAEWAVRHWDPASQERVRLLWPFFLYHPSRTARAMLEEAAGSPNEGIRAEALEGLRTWDADDYWYVDEESPS